MEQDRQECKLQRCATHFVWTHSNIMALSRLLLCSLSPLIVSHCVASWILSLLHSLTASIHFSKCHLWILMEIDTGGWPRDKWDILLRHGEWPWSNFAIRQIFCQLRRLHFWAIRMDFLVDLCYKWWMLISPFINVAIATTKMPQSSQLWFQFMAAMNTLSTRLLSGKVSSDDCSFKHPSKSHDLSLPDKQSRHSCLFYLLICALHCLYFSQLLNFVS